MPNLKPGRALFALVRVFLLVMLAMSILQGLRGHSIPALVIPVVLFLIVSGLGGKIVRRLRQIDQPRKTTKKASASKEVVSQRS